MHTRATGAGSCSAAMLHVAAQAYSSRSGAAKTPHVMMCHLLCLQRAAVRMCTLSSTPDKTGRSHDRHISRAVLCAACNATCVAQHHTNKGSNTLP
jgi:hypothetical protein